MRLEPRSGGAAAPKLIACGVRRVFASSLRWPFVALALFAACSRIEVDLPVAASLGPEERVDSAASQAVDATRHRVGFARVDITPTPGVPMGGHSVEASTGMGAWTPLEARVVYLEDARGRAAAFVVCDLWSVSEAFTHRVSEAVRTRHGLPQLGRESLSISATHTHHSPGNFAGDKMYNDFASSSAGFDPELEAFLVERVALAVATAARAAEPAQLDYIETRVGGVARQRSMPAYLANPEAATQVAANGDLPGCGPDPELPDGPDRCHAVDPTLRMLRAKNEDGSLRGVFGIFPVHPVALPRDVEAYHADLFGIARQVATARLAAPASADAGAETGAPPFVVLANGPEGDVSPNYEVQGRPEALRVGRLFGRALADAARSDAARPIEGLIEHRWTRVPIENQEVDGHRTGARAVPGRAQFPGAEDGRTRMMGRIYHEGARAKRERLRGQGVKAPAFPSLFLLIGLPRWSTPRELPLAIHRLGPLVFANLPGEFTTTMGARVRAAVAAGAKTTTREPAPILLGLTDAYASYFTTPEEYAEQHYEGGSTLFGPWSGTYLAAKLAALFDFSGDPPRHFATAPGPRKHLNLRPGIRARRLARTRGVLAPEQLQSEGPWIHIDDRFVELGSEVRTMPEARLEVRGADGTWRPALRSSGLRVDDDGIEFLRHVDGARRDTLGWRIHWLGTEADPDLGTLDPADRYRIHVVDAEGLAHCSESFSLPAPAAQLETTPCHATLEPALAPSDRLG